MGYFAYDFSRSQEREDTGIMWVGIGVVGINLLLLKGNWFFMVIFRSMSRTL